MEIMIQTVGWLGSFLLIFAYILVSAKKVDGSSKVYQAMNLFGAIGVGVSVFHQGAWPAFMVNVFWCTVAVIALLKVSNKR
ncbi:MAG: hypothetical protein HZB11_00915 [Candidatus Yonathbacteria bacterium]|nr:hypothetical protein [Candidatus Yonathbacteria bacterium]